MSKLKEEYKNAEVVVRVRCAECEGRKSVQHPMWALYWRVTEGRGDYERFFHNEGLDEVPDEEVECGECEGDGFYETYVKLDDLFEEDGFELARRKLVETLNTGAAKWPGPLSELDELGGGR